MNDEEYKKLESRIYAFSIDVFSFVKTLINKNLSNQQTKDLLASSNKLYSEFLDAIDNEGNMVSEVMDTCVQICKNCSNYLENIKVEQKLLNEKVDLTIEANELGRLLNRFIIN